MGRSTGKHFREKGVSLYKDKEISTTHAKVGVHVILVLLFDNIIRDAFFSRSRCGMDRYS
jgi:hypothetical protein